MLELPISNTSSTWFEGNGLDYWNNCYYQSPNSSDSVKSYPSLDGDNVVKQSKNEESCSNNFDPTLYLSEHLCEENFSKNDLQENDKHYNCNYVTQADNMLPSSYHAPTAPQTVYDDPDNTVYTASYSEWRQNYAAANGYELLRCMQSKFQATNAGLHDNRVRTNLRKRERNLCINQAFDKLKEKIPNLPHDSKVSKIKVLRLASGYIRHLSTVLTVENTVANMVSFI